MDRITSILYPDGTTRQFTWSKLDLASVTDRLGRSTQYTYDAVRNLVDVGDPIHRHTTFSYYANKHLKSVRDPDGNTTSWNIDIQSRVTAKQYADGREWITTYEDTASRVKSVGDPSGQVTQYSYAVDDGLSGINYSNAINPTPTVSFSYDPYFRRLVSMSDESGTTQYQYVPVGTLGALKVRSESGPFLNSTIGYQYDALGRILTREVDASRETFAYDKLGRMVNHSGPLGIFTFEYLGQTQQMISRMLGSGSVQTHWMYGTNANDRRLRYINNGAAARNFGFNTNSESLITTLNQTGVTSPQSWTYSYDASNRLLSGKSSLGPQFSYSYDAADNLLTAQSPSGNVNASYNNVNQVINFGTSVFVYDVNGNLTSDGVRTYQWDAANRLVDIGINNVPGSHVSIKYDGIGRRIGLIMSNGAGAAEKRYLWCGGALCQARNSSDVVIRRYYPEGELSSDGPQYYSQDQLGSIRDVLNGMTGYSISAFDYDPYGNPTETRGHSLTDFRYAGLFFEQNSGLYLARHRVYDPKSTRWLSRDPLAEAASGINLYEYVNQNPINGVDTTGLQSWLDSLYAWLSGPAKEPIKPTDIGGEAMNMVPSTVAIAATVANIQTERRAYERYLDAIGTDQQDAALAAWNQTKTNLRTAEQAMQLSNEIPGNPSWLDALELWYKGLMDKLGCSQ
jgi:RHS repeat-associated protein